MVAMDMVATVVRGRLRLRLTVDMGDTAAMEATDMVATVARERLRPRLTVDMVDTAAMEAMDMVATVVRGRLRPRLTAATDMVVTVVDTVATDTMVIKFVE